MRRGAAGAAGGLQFRITRRVTPLQYSPRFNSRRVVGGFEDLRNGKFTCLYMDLYV